MNLNIRPVCDNDVDALVRFSLLAWEPVFRSFKQMLGPKIYPIIYPDWKTTQREEIEKVCRDGEKYNVWVAELAGLVVGFVALTLNMETKRGEIYFLAVHPDHQNLGIGTELNNFALGEMKASGMTMAELGTGGDPSHAPARRSYEKAGYTALPLVRYYKEL